jgi:hypothetical protein
MPAYMRGLILIGIGLERLNVNSAYLIGGGRLPRKRVFEHRALRVAPAHRNAARSGRFVFKVLWFAGFL